MLSTFNFQLSLSTFSFSFHRKMAMVFETERRYRHVTVFSFFPFKIKLRSKVLIRQFFKKSEGTLVFQFHFVTALFYHKIQINQGKRERD